MKIKPLSGHRQEGTESLKVIVTVKSSGCLQIGFGLLIIDYISGVYIVPNTLKNFLGPHFNFLKSFQIFYL